MAQHPCRSTEIKLAETVDDKCTSVCICVLVRIQSNSNCDGSRKIKVYFECKVSLLKNSTYRRETCASEALCSRGLVDRYTTQQPNSIVPNREHKERSENWSVRYCGTGNRRFHLWKRVQKSATRLDERKSTKVVVPSVVHIRASILLSSYRSQTDITVSCLCQGGGVGVTRRGTETAHMPQQ